MILPRDFTDYTRKLMGDSLYGTFEKALDEEPPVSIRLNPFKADIAKRGQSMEGHGARRVPWCEYGYYLNSRPVFTFDPAFHAGLYYVQEASSMFVCEVVRQLVHKPVTVLDLCAAPGGKTTALRSVLPEGSLLVANEPIKTRASILKENVMKMGHPDVMVTNNYPFDFVKAKMPFDVILADVPCSGEGMFRKDRKAVTEWSQNNVAKCWQLQRSIVETIWPFLRKDGLLIYSTCTLNAHEDEENVKFLADNLGADLVKIHISDDWNITGSLVDDSPVYRFIPGKTKGEGLFMAVLRKRGEARCIMENPADMKRRKLVRMPVDTKEISKWIKGDYFFTRENRMMLAIPKWWEEIFKVLRTKLNVIHAGIGVGIIRGPYILPDASLAMSTVVNREAFPNVDLSYDDAIRYLRHETLTLDSSLPHGPVLMTYKNYPLGFMKNIGPRANNLYPLEWEIKSTHLPEQPQDPLGLL